MEEALLALLKDALIPEIAIVFRAHANAGLPPPTSDQVMAALALDVSRVVTIGQAFLAATAPAVVPPAPGPVAVPAPGTT